MRQVQTWIRRILFSTSGALLASALPTAIAADGLDELQEVVVLARKFEENLQDVPLTISVIDQTVLREKVVRDLNDIAKLTPGFTFEQGATTGDFKPNIRGLTAVRGRPNVAILIDGVDQTTESIGVPGGGLLAGLRFSDICQIEVVKGPQSVLYGRSAFGGAVSYTTCRPDSTNANGEMQVGVGDFGSYEAGFVTNLPISEVSAVRFTASMVNFDGDWKNPVTGGRLNARETTSASAAWQYEPDESFSVFLRVQHSKDDASQPARISVAPVDVTNGQLLTENNGVFAPYYTFNARSGTTSLAALFPGGPLLGYFTQSGDMTTTAAARNREIQLSADPRTGSDFAGSTVKNTRALLELTWEREWGSIKSLSAVLQSEQVTSEDFDYTDDRVSSTGLGIYAPLAFPSPGNPFPMLGYTPANPPPTFALSALRETDGDIDQISQEFVFRSDFTGPLQFQADLLYWREKTEVVDRSQFWCKEGSSAFFCGVIGAFLPGGSGNPFAPPLTRPVAKDDVRGPAPIVRDQESFSLGVGVEYTVSDDIRVGLGGRYFDETYKYEGYPFDQFPVRTFGGPIPTVVTPTAKVKSSKFVPQLTADWRYSQDSLLFASVAKGFKPGGVDTTGNTGFVDEISRQFKPENLLAAELGSKNEFLNRRVRLNGAIFYNHYTDQQVPINVQVGALPQTGTINIGESETYGVELALDFRATENLDLGLRYTYTHAEFTDYEVPAGPLSFTAASAPGGSGVITDPAGTIVRPGSISDRSESLLAGYVPESNSLASGNPNNLGVIFGATGYRVPRVPENQLTALIRFGFDMGAARGYVGADAQYQSKRFLTQYNLYWLPDFTRVNLQAGFDVGAWSVQGYVNNLFDDDTITNGGTSSLFGFFDLRNNQLPRQGVLIAPDKRLIGIRATYRFGT